MDVVILPFIRQVIENTKNHVCSWEKVGPDTYRLLLRNGSITVKKEPEPIVANPIEPDVLYRLRLFDQVDCFYSLNIDNRLSEEYVKIDELFQSIRDEEIKVINSKITELSKGF